MNLTFIEDYSTNEVLDTQLLGVPESGIYFNRGTHSLVTVSNILDFLSSKTIVFKPYSSVTTYGEYMNTRKKDDVVSYLGKIYQSLVSTNLNHIPSASPTYWLETNLDSLKIKSEIFNAEDCLIQALALNRKLIENQYIYNVGNKEVSLAGDYSGWAFEPKGSDYVKIRINQMSLQAMTDTDVNLYVINQGVIIDTIVLHPNNGILSFENTTLTLSGKGVFYLVFDSQVVLSNNAYNDPLRYSGFICYPVQGDGVSPASATYKHSSCNGLNFNVSVYTDTNMYITNNIIDFSSLLQSQFELNMLKMFYHNPNNIINGNISMIKDSGLLYNEIMGIEGETVIRKYKRDLKQAEDAINRTYDKIIKPVNKLTIKIGTI